MQCRFPFGSSKSSGAAADDQQAADANIDPYATGPWLPMREQRRLRRLWPKSVPFPEGLLFYKLPTASQQLAKVNSMEYRAFHTERNNTARQFPWDVSGGMDYSPRSTWENHTGLAIPEGAAIDVWTEMTPVFNGSNDQYERQLSWQFPKGTVAVDMLMSKATGKPFEIRVREKSDVQQWDDGIAYRPDLLGGTAKYNITTDNRLRRTLGLESINYKFKTTQPQEDKDYTFKASSVATTDGHVVPAKYQGPGVSCNKCHVAGVEQSLYNGPILRRKDTVFSFYPVTVQSVLRNDYLPTIDRRWPVRVYR